jgi:hypothetical protein
VSEVAFSGAHPVQDRPRTAVDRSAAGHVAAAARAMGNHENPRGDVRTGRGETILSAARESRIPRCASCVRACIGRAVAPRVPAWQLAAAVGLTLAAIALQAAPAAGFWPLADRSSAKNDAKRQHLRHFCRAGAVLPTPCPTLASAIPLPQHHTSIRQRPAQPHLGSRVPYPCRAWPGQCAVTRGPTVWRQRGWPGRGQGKCVGGGGGYRLRSTDFPTSRGAHATRV